MKILVINGPNLNMLGIREPTLYGKSDYRTLKNVCKETAKSFGAKIKIVQSNCEGEIVTLIQRSLKKNDGIIINAGAYTHTSIAILDALKSVQIPTVEVHLTDINKREDFRKISFVGLYAEKSFIGEGINGYKSAIKYLIENYDKKD